MAEAKSERRNLFLIGFSMFIMIILSAGLQTAVGILFRGTLHDGSSWVKYALALTPQYFVAMPAAYVLLRIIPETRLKKKSLTAGRFLIVLLVCYAILYAGNLIATLITAIIDAATGKTMQNIVAEMVSGSDFLANLLIVGITAPVVEELFFRKLLIGRLLRYGDKVAVITSGLIFGLVHGNFSQFFYASGLGLALGYIYIRTGKITYTIALHIFINVFSGIISPLLVKSGGAAMLLYAAAIIGMAVAGTVLFFVNKRRIWFADSECRLERWPASVYLNPGMILFFIACAALFTFKTIEALAVK